MEQLFLRSDNPNEDDPELTWLNVGIALSFILVDVIFSITLGLGIEKSVLVASARCLIQLTLMGFVLDSVFTSQNPFFIFALVFLLVFLGAFEAVFNRSKQRFDGMFLVILFSLASAVCLVGLLGVRFALSQVPVWEPTKLIPIVGMLLGNAISGVSIATNHCLTQVVTNSAQIETWLAFGASRWEVGRQLLLKPGLRIGMLPTITQMSVIGLVSIPGMMTGAILGGASISQAVRYQQIIMFLISATTTLAVTLTCVICMILCLDGTHRLRPDRVSGQKPWMWRWRDNAAMAVWRGAKRAWKMVTCRAHVDSDDEGHPENGENHR